MNVNIKEALGWQPRGADFFRPYICEAEPPLDSSKLDLDLLAGTERQSLRAPFTGTYTIALKYKGRTGAVTSLEEVGGDLVVLQLQGVHGRRGYRVTSGISWIELFADEVTTVAEHPSLPIRRLCMPRPILIDGLVEEIARREDVDTKYLKFAAEASLKYSQAEQAYIRDIKQK